jgi:stage II sporulation protein AB (anti-sigma F factor)
MKNNEFCLEIDSISENEQFARTVVAAYVVRLNPTVDELEDVKAAVSEAVTNCVIHAYEHTIGKIWVRGRVEDNILVLEIEDKGRGILDIPKAMAPFYTSKPEEERSGMGFTFMQSFVDEVQVESRGGEGTKVVLKKAFSTEEVPTA